MTSLPLCSYEKAWAERIRSGSTAVSILLDTFREDGVDFVEYFDDEDDANEAQEFFVVAWTNGSDPAAVRKAAKKKTRKMFFSLFRGGFRFILSGRIPAWLRTPDDIELVSWSPTLVDKELLLEPLRDESSSAFLKKAIAHARDSSRDPEEDTLEAWIEPGEKANEILDMVGPQAVATGTVADDEWMILTSTAEAGQRITGTLHLSRSSDLPAALLAWFPSE